MADNQNDHDGLDHRVTFNINDVSGGHLTGIMNNYGTFVPPDENDPDAMRCPRATCRRLIYRDNHECAYCKFDLNGYFRQISERQAYIREQKRLEEIEVKKFKHDLAKMMFVGVLIIIAIISGMINSYFEHDMFWLNFLPFGIGFSIFFMIANWDKF